MLENSKPPIAFIYGVTLLLLICLYSPNCHQNETGEEESWRLCLGSENKLTRGWAAIVFQIEIPSLLALIGPLRGQGEAVQVAQRHPNQSKMWADEEWNKFLCNFQRRIKMIQEKNENSIITVV